ncbi:MAG: CoA-binding protein, partial [Thermodesulfobacteriota bacterium]
MSGYTETSKKQLDRIFHPRRLAVIGVSGDSVGFGSRTILTLQQFGFNGEIFPVNPKGGTIAGLSIYKTIEEIPGDLDLAIIAVPAPYVPSALEACRQKGVVGAEILSAGFKELATPQGLELEKQIKDIVKKGIRVVGPNCFGIYCPAGGLTILPGPEFPQESGPVAFLAQSGGMAGEFVWNGKSLGFRFSKVVSFGNGVDLRETELLGYLGEDPETKVICMYMEGVEEGQDFFKVLKEVTSRKPVIVYKGGLSKSGSRAVISHTASLGGSRQIWDAMLRQANAVQVNNSWEMAQTALAFSILPERTYRRVAAVGGGGALGVSAADTAELYGIDLPLLSPETQERIMTILPKPGSSATNPVDAANPGVPPEILKEVLLLSGKEKGIDFQILIQLFFIYKSFLRLGGEMTLDEITPYRGLEKALNQVQDETDKPVVLILPNSRRNVEDLDLEEVRRRACGLLFDNKILVYENLTD